MLWPMASSTCEGSSEPDAHADPLETASPARSRARSMSSPLRSAKVQLAKLGSRSSPPVSVPPSSRSAERSASLCRLAAAARASCSRDTAVKAAASAPAVQTSSIPARRPHSCGPPYCRGWTRTPSRTYSKPPRPAPSLWPLNETRSAPGGTGIQRAPAQASTWTSAPTSRAHEVGALVHVDACAGARWIPVPPGADLVSFSGHKLGAGRGGLLYVREGVRVQPLQYGGPQEWGRRAGIEDVWTAGALAAAFTAVSREHEARAAAASRQSEALRSALLELGGTLTGGDERLPNFASCTFADRKGEDMLLALDLAGLAVSSGSACASGSLDPSHVLLAMGQSMELALGSLRLTTGYATTDEEIDEATRILHAVLGRARTHA